MTQVRNKFNEVRFLSYIYVFPSILAKQLSQYQTTELSFGRYWSIQTIPSSWIKQNPKHYEGTRTHFKKRRIYPPPSSSPE